MSQTVNVTTVHANHLPQGGVGGHGGGAVIMNPDGGLAGVALGGGPPNPQPINQLVGGQDGAAQHHPPHVPPIQHERHSQ